MMRVYPWAEEGRPIDYEGKYILSAGKIFDLHMKREWFDDPVVKQMIRDIDNTEHIRGSLFESPVLGDISAKELSGGVKGLILVYKCFAIPRVFASYIWGDNCCEWLRKLSFMVDFSFYFAHPIAFFLREPIMAQRYTTLDWKTRDFEMCNEVYDYYIDYRLSHLE